MSANIFKIKGEKINSKDFLKLMSQKEICNILYYNDSLSGETRTPLIIRDKEFTEVSFKDTNIDHVIFINCSFDKCLFIGVRMFECEIVNCNFFNTNTHKIKIKGSLIDPKQFRKNFDFKEDSNIAIDFYHEIYKNSVEQHQNSYSTEALYKMKVAENSQLKFEYKKKRISKSKFLFKRCLNFIYDISIGYGLKIHRIIFLFLFLVIFLSAINYMLRSSIFPCLEDFSIIDSIYFTSVTITTLGFGDIAPQSDIGKIIIIPQVFVGFGILSLLLAAMSKKILGSL